VRFALFYHSVRSDWNHGKAHFLRGLMRSLIELGHDPVCYEEEGNWSTSNLVAEHGLRPLVEFRRRFTFADVRLYQPEPLRQLEVRLARELSGVDVVMIDDWPAAENASLVDMLARLKSFCGFTLLLHDTHYRILTQPSRMARLGLDRFDAILAYGPSIADEYRRRFGLKSVHVFHEAADTALFRPLPSDPERPMDDALFIGNWGGKDRAHEMREFLLLPARRFRETHRIAIHGVRYPPAVLARLRHYYGIEYRGWLPNFLVPEAFAQAQVVIHVIRRQYMRALHGIPTIRPFEVFACGKPLVSTRWHDTDNLFRAGEDYLVVDTRAQMQQALEWLWQDEPARALLGRNGLQRILESHTCMHRAEQLLGIIARLRMPVALPEVRSVAGTHLRRDPAIESIPAGVAAGNGRAHGVHRKGDLAAKEAAGESGTGVVRRRATAPYPKAS
jgi:spore maturation protein CgeB